jgi:hypothetical protein
MRAYHEIPLSAQYTSPVSNGPDATQAQKCSSPVTLPLNLILLIISYLDEIGDIARATRTCRLLYYMTLPQLYESVNLSTTARPRNGPLNEVTRHGIGSPFMMALNGLISNPHAALVKQFRLRGKWQESNATNGNWESNSDGRVSDSTMMLNIITRSIAARMSKLQSIAWELQDCLPLTTMYQGIASHNTLTRLTIRFPSPQSAPRVATIVPPMPNLRAFTALEIDPEGNPDDFSKMLLESRKLEDLRFHFTSRIRRQGFPIIDFEGMFWRLCRQAGHTLRLKHFALQNFVAKGKLTIEPGLFDVETLQSVCILDSFGEGENEFRAFLSAEEPQHVDVGKIDTNFRKMRCNEVLPQFVAALRRRPQSIHSFIMVGTKKSRRVRQRSQTSSTSSSNTTASNPPSPSWDPVALTRVYLQALTQIQGASLRILLLSDEFELSKEQLGNVVRCCPNLEQFGFGLDDPDHNLVRILMPFLTKLQCMRILDNDQSQEHMRVVSDEDRMMTISTAVARAGNTSVKYVGVAQTLYRIGGMIEYLTEDGTPEMRRIITRADLAEVQKYALWGSDCLDIAADEYGPFST